MRSSSPPGLIKRSRFGLALRSIGESEEAAAHTGVNVNRVKAVTFGVSAFFMGLTGATMCMRWSYIDPTTAFSIQYSFMPVLMAIFGGMGHLYAPVLGANHLLSARRAAHHEIPLLLHAYFRPHHAYRYRLHALRPGRGCREMAKKGKGRTCDVACDGEKI